VHTPTRSSTGCSPHPGRFTTQSPRSASGQPREVIDAEDDTATVFDWKHHGVSLGLGRDLPLYAGRLVGGSSATNNVMALRGDSAGYDAWAAAGNVGWSFADLVPAFNRVEHDLDFPSDPWHGAAGPVSIRRPLRSHPEHASAHQAFLEACVHLGHRRVDDHNKPGSVGAGPLPVNEVDGTRLHADSVVLCAGAFGSPAILLRSGVGPAADRRALGIEVRHDAAGVGRNLHDHPLLRLAFAANGEPCVPARRTILTARSDPAQPQPDVQVFPSGPTKDTGPATLTLLVALLTPLSRGRLRLTSIEPTAPPRIDPGHVTHPGDLPRLQVGVDLARELVAHPRLAERFSRVSRASSDLLCSRGAELGRAILEQVSTGRRMGRCPRAWPRVSGESRRVVVTHLVRAFSDNGSPGPAR